MRGGTSGIKRKIVPAEEHIVTAVRSPKNKSHDDGFFTPLSTPGGARTPCDSVFFEFFTPDISTESRVTPSIAKS